MSLATIKKARYRRYHAEQKHTLYALVDPVSPPPQTALRRAVVEAVLLMRSLLKSQERKKVRFGFTWAVGFAWGNYFHCGQEIVGKAPTNLTRLFFLHRRQLIFDLPARAGYGDKRSSK